MHTLHRYNLLECHFHYYCGSGKLKNNRYFDLNDDFCSTCFAVEIIYCDVAYVNFHVGDFFPYNYCLLSTYCFSYDRF